MNRRYTVDDVGMINFFQMPKDLYYNPFYRSLNNNDRTAYMFLRDRQDLSIKNKWVDKNGDIFFYFDCQKLAELLQISTSTVNKCKKALTNCNLLMEQRQGQGKPNKMYILKTEHVDISLISENDISSIANSNKLDKRKSLCNDTELNKTNVKRLNTNYEPQSGFTARFLNLFETYFGYKHRRILKEVDETNLEGIDIETFSYMVTEYFDKYGTNDKQHNLEKCSIDNVFTSAIRYSMLNEW